MIVKPREMDFSQKKISMIVAGLPGIGKTTGWRSLPIEYCVERRNIHEEIDFALRAYIGKYCSCVAFSYK